MVPQECFAPNNIVMAVQRRSPLKTRVDQVIDWIREGGFIAHSFLTSLRTAAVSKVRHSRELGNDFSYFITETFKYHYTRITTWFTIHGTYRIISYLPFRSTSIGVAKMKQIRKRRKRRKGHFKRLLI